MGPISAIRNVLQNYATFSQRARRSEFWYWYLTILSVSVGMAVLAYYLGTGFLGQVVIAAFYVFWLAILVPTVAVSIRRLHDAGYSAWWFILYFIPVLGLLLLLLYTLPPTDGPNKYGPKPA